MKLLLIDDNPRRASWLEQRLKKENNFVSTSLDLQQGLTIAQQLPYDIALLNLQLTDSKVVDKLYAELNKQEHVPLVVLISPDTPTNRALSLEAGADDCVGTGVEFRELLARLKVIYRRRVGHFKIQITPIIHIDDLEIRLLEKTVYRGGKRLDLLKREYYLLEFLAQNMNRVVTKKEIIDRVWNNTPAIRKNTVEVYINYLRKKVDKAFEKKLIHTITGLGYKFCIKSPV